MRKTGKVMMGFCVVVIGALILPILFPAAAVAGAARPVPSAALMERLNAEEDVIGIVHWGLNTYTDKEWGYGDEKPEILNPAKFDADQIAQACAAGGLKGLVVVAKHHDGFCLWPTKTTEHNITKSPFRGGKGDYVTRNGGCLPQGRNEVRRLRFAVGP